MISDACDFMGVRCYTHISKLNDENLDEIILS
jgi:hypothetical protein